MPIMNLYDMVDVWNNGLNAFSAISINITDTASAANSTLVWVRKSGTDVLRLRKDGVMALTGRYAIGGMTSSNPSLSANGALLEVKLADNSNFANFQAAAITGTTGTFNNSGVKIRDTNASHVLSFAVGSDLSVNRTLTFTTGDADRTLTINADVTLDQATSTSSSPQFAGINIGHATDTTITRVSPGVIAVEGQNVLLANGIGSTIQGYDALLNSIAGLTFGADNYIYGTGSDTAAVGTITTFGRSLVDDADASTARSTLGLVIGTNVQAYSANLASWSGIAPSAKQDALGFTPVNPTRALNVAGLVTGGGDLSADRTFTVTAASLAEAEAKSISNKAVIPSNLTNFALLTAPQQFTRLQYTQPFALTSGAAWDGTLYNHVTVNVNGSTFTIANPSSATTGAVYLVYVTYTTTHSLSWGNQWKGLGSITPTATAGAIDSFTFRWNGSNMILLGYNLNGGA